jgi:hypothetical protein
VCRTNGLASIRRIDWADVGVKVAKGLGRPRRPDPGVCLDARLELVIGEVSMPQSVWWMRMISVVLSRALADRE